MRPSPYRRGCHRPSRPRGNRVPLSSRLTPATTSSGCAHFRFVVAEVTDCFPPPTRGCIRIARDAHCLPGFPGALRGDSSLRVSPTVALRLLGRCGDTPARPRPVSFRAAARRG
ncbi:hypothetical protein SCATT_24030 [Streptantibioticus cattleyicolor NRRL 8057 = DSM 46488]|uniref:Uncharacterized protein n=1 Tax=Streptantibioticus cattleyicolor (strain ATCC 35852 / DSM 46488 / JCM 4925 / NBRC 14057 / NRRL 8057) TaxID=1003195 RepID=G8WS14_STREN|nr:hypothetical protein SCATT_24030 [Streptantibioticus cattleyicolor NRRL 8057 = DSM 46488]